MNTHPLFTNLRSYVSYQFSSLRSQARREQLWAKMTGTESILPVFPGKAGRISPSRKLIGITNIRVDQIVGTLYQHTDFDARFRPLKKHNLDRWVNTYILQEQNGWAPIVVHKIGEQYFVEDGHHRVSVARALGMDFIEAKVWEYAAPPKSADTCQSAKCMEKKPARAYAAG